MKERCIRVADGGAYYTHPIAAKAVIQDLANLVTLGQASSCPDCGGRGRYRAVVASGNSEVIECPRCDGWTVIWGCHGV